MKLHCHNQEQAVFQTSFCIQYIPFQPFHFRQHFEKTVKIFNIKISEKPAEIENGFILTYGLISENCSFRAIIEAERDSLRDMAAAELFGQVKK